ncbi:MAG: aminoacyl-tRNA hydrolase [Elusimicrobiales bacterium]
MSGGALVIAGLGNPGPRYARTRHNAGFMLADEVARRAGAEGWQSWRGMGQCARGEHAGRKFWLVKPQTFMNDSGVMVRAFADYHGAARGDVLVCCDDIALELGRIRIRGGGSSGGHNGVKSVIAHLGGMDFPRLRMGIGPRPAWMEGAAFVLERFSETEREPLSQMLDEAAKAALEIVENGVEAAMNRHNRAPDGGKPK